MSRFSLNKWLKTVYIFCEWCTEEKYFTRIKTLYRKTPVNIRKIINVRRWHEFKNIRKLNEKIFTEIKKDKITWINPEKWIYAIFDLDIFTKKEIDDLYAWIDTSITIIPSNWTFEYWILSHFQEYNKKNKKNEYIIKIKEHLAKIPFTISNDKFTNQNDFNWLENKEQIDFAIQNVKKINSTTSGNVKDRDPYSDVYKIIEFLNS